MRLALDEAEIAAREGEIPIGCVIRGADGRELGRGHNQREQLNDVSAHAEIVALRRAAKGVASWRLIGVTAYVTLEPCPMCAAALVHARVSRVVYGCDDPKGGGAFSLYEIGQDSRLNHQFAITRGVLADVAAVRLRDFFARLRRAGKK